MQNHLTITILKNGEFSYKLPERKLPRKVFKQEQNLICGGYFIGWDTELTDQQIFTLCKNGRWDFLANIIGDFIIFLFDQDNQKLQILTSQTGVPCYFANTNNSFYISTSFSQIKQQIHSPTLNLNSAFDYFRYDYCNLPQDFTILNEINQIPPATLLSIDKNFTVQLKTSLEYKIFFNSQLTPFSSVDKFRHEVVKLTTELIEEKLNKLSKIQNLKIAAELTSGYDSSLVAYALSESKLQPPIQYFSWFSDLDKHDNNLENVTKFANKHQLQIAFWNKEPFYPFGSSEDLKLTIDNFYPAIFAQNLSLGFYNYLSQNGIDVVFNGNGGDELYGVHELIQTHPYFMQLDYYETIVALEWDFDTIFTQKAKEFFISRERFINRKFYPTIIPTSALIQRLYFPVFWEYDIWPILPLADPRLIRLFCQIPTDGSKRIKKEDLWKGHQGIYLPEQLVPKSKLGTGSFIKQFIVKEMDFIIKTLANSLLAEQGLIKRDTILKNLKDGRGDIYSHKNLAFFHNLIRLEYFLQENHIRVSNI